MPSRTTADQLAELCNRQTAQIKAMREAIETLRAIAHTTGKSLLGCALKKLYKSAGLE